MKKLLKAGVALAFGMALTGAAHADITIATAGPMTGQYAAFGAQMKAGAEQAVADINAKGGVLGQKLILEVGDDACDPKQAVAVANQLAGKGVVVRRRPLLLGFVDPGLGRLHRLLRSSRSRRPRPTRSSPTSVPARACSASAVVTTSRARSPAPILAKNFKDKNIAIIDDKSAYGKGLADETRKYMNEAGKTEVLNESYNAGEKDYTALVSKLKQANVDVLYVGGYHTEAGLIARQMRDQGMKTILVSGDALVTDEYWQITGDAGEGTLMTFSPDPRKNPIAKPVVEALDGRRHRRPKATRSTPTPPSRLGPPPSPRPAAPTSIRWSPFSPAAEFDTVLGEVKFDDKGDVTLPGYVFYVWHDGKYDYVEVRTTSLLGRFSGRETPAATPGFFLGRMPVARAVPPCSIVRAMPNDAPHQPSGYPPARLVSSSPLAGLVALLRACRPMPTSSSASPVR